MIESMVEIVEVVSAQLDIPVAVIMGKERTRDVSDARNIAMELSWFFFGKQTTKTTIARFFNVDHCTIIHAIAKARNLSEDKSFKLKYAPCLKGCIDATPVKQYDNIPQY